MKKEYPEEYKAIFEELRPEKSIEAEEKERDERIKKIWKKIEDEIKERERAPKNKNG